jgi:hypothetical protein
LANHGQEGRKAFVGDFTKKFFSRFSTKEAPLVACTKIISTKEGFSGVLQRKAHVRPGQKKAK